MARAAVVFAMMTRSHSLSARTGGYCELLDGVRQLRVRVLDSWDDYVTRLKFKPRPQSGCSLQLVYICTALRTHDHKAVGFHDQYRFLPIPSRLVDHTCEDSTRKLPKVKLCRTFRTTSRAIFNSTSNILSDLVASSNVMYSTEA